MNEAGQGLSRIEMLKSRIRGELEKRNPPKIKETETGYVVTETLARIEEGINGKLSPVTFAELEDMKAKSLPERKYEQRSLGALECVLYPELASVQIETTKLKSPDDPIFNIFDLLVDSMTWAKVVDSPPVIESIFGGGDLTKKPPQYTRRKDVLGNVREVRAIAGFAEFPNLLRKTLALLVESQQGDRVAFVGAFDRFADSMQVTRSQLALGLIEIIHTAHLLTVPKYLDFALDLKYIVYYEHPYRNSSLADNYKLIQKKYKYQSTENAQFWMMPFKPGINSNADRSNQLFERNQAKPFESVPVAQWDAFLVQRNKLLSRHRQLQDVPGKVIREQPSAANEAKVSRSFELIKERRELEQEERRATKGAIRDEENRWSTWAKALSKSVGAIELTPAQNKQMAESIVAVMELYKDHPLIPPKVARFIDNSKHGVAGEYAVDPRQYLNKAIYSFLFALQKPEVAAGFVAGVKQDPVGFEMLFRTQMYGIMSTSLADHEEKLILDQNHAQFATENSENIVNLARRLVSIFTSSKSYVEDEDHKTLFIQTLARYAGIEKQEKYTDDERKRLTVELRGLTGRGVFKHIAQFRQDNLDFIALQSLGIPAELKRKLKIGAAIAVGAIGIIGGGVALDEQYRNNMAIPAGEWFEQQRSKNYDRMPDSSHVSKQDLEQSSPLPYAFLIHAPDGNSQFSGFIPGNMIKSDTGTSGHYYEGTLITETQDIDPAQYMDEQSPFINSVSPLSVINLSQLPQEFPEDSLVYKVRNPNRIILPPEGYEITTIYADKTNHKPVRDVFGMVRFDAPNTDMPSVIVIEAHRKQKDSTTEAKSGVTVLPKIEGGLYRYAPFNNPGYVGADLASTTMRDLVDRPSLNDKAKDDKLVALYDAFNTDMRHLAQFEGETEDERLTRLSDKIIAFVNDYVAHTNKNRSYRLNFNADPQATGVEAGGDNSVFVKMVRSPDAGYFCLTAASGLVEALRSTGVRAFVLTGENIQTFGKQLWTGSLGHAKVEVILPDGRKLIVDATPPITDQTPPEDRKLLEDSGRRIPTKEEQEYFDLGVTAEQLLFQGLLGAGVTTALALSLKRLGVNLRDKTKRDRYNAISRISLYGDSPEPGGKVLNRTTERMRPFAKLEAELLAATIYSLASIPFDIDYQTHVNQLIETICKYKPTTNALGIQWFLPEITNPVSERIGVTKWEQTAAYGLSAESDEEAFELLSKQVLEGNSMLTDMPSVVIDALKAYANDKATVIPQEFKDIRALARMVNTLHTGSLRETMLVNLGLSALEDRQHIPELRKQYVDIALKEAYAKDHTAFSNNSILVHLTQQVAI